MSIFSKILNRQKISPEEREKALSYLKMKYESFRRILDANTKALKIMGDMEEKSQGDYIFDIHYITSSVEKLKNEVGSAVDNLVSLGGNRYEALMQKYNEIDSEIEGIIIKKPYVPKDSFTLALDKIDRSKSDSAGSKNANLGEIKNKLDIPVPDGFAITAYAYKYFMECNKLQQKINELIETTDINDSESLDRISHIIRQTIYSADVPDEISKAIIEEFKKINNDNKTGLYAIRSSAIGEDTGYSFAGQYVTVLGAREENIIPAYKEVIVSKFSSRAIYYFLSHSLDEQELAMSAGCYEMVDARAAGVIYTKDPVNPDNNSMIISSVFGLGKYLVDGVVSPDVFKVERNPIPYEDDQKIKIRVIQSEAVNPGVRLLPNALDSSLRSAPFRMTVPQLSYFLTSLGARSLIIAERTISKKQVELKLDPQGGTINYEIPPERQELPSVGDDEILRLGRMALKIEEHYGHPQDIEWAIDKNGDIYILQTRPLRVVKKREEKGIAETSGLDIIMKCGETACPGAGSGAVVRIDSPGDIHDIPDNSVIVAEMPFPELIRSFSKTRAIITKFGSIASHMVTIAREYRIPTLVCVNDIDKLTDGRTVTVDATNGIVYEGEHQELVESLKPEFEYFEDEPLFLLLDKLTDKISPLNLIDPKSDSFTSNNCRTFHDIIRYAHQKAMEEMFSSTESYQNKGIAALPLKSSIPLKTDIICLDCGQELLGKKLINENEIQSRPFKAFWEGILKEGWNAPPTPKDASGFLSVVARDMSSQNLNKLAEKSYAVISQELMIFSIKMGYHYSTIESVASPASAANYIKLTFKEGGASFERRLRRINILRDILERAGFNNSIKGDFLESGYALEDAERICQKLFLLGRLTMLTRQLDMALNDDETAREFRNDIVKKLFGSEGNYEL